MSASMGLCSGKMRSTPTPLEILRTVKVALTPEPRRAMHTPSNAWIRSFSPSLTRTFTRMVSPAREGGMFVRSHSFWVSMKACICHSGREPGLRRKVFRLGNLVGVEGGVQPRTTATASTQYQGIWYGDQPTAPHEGVAASQVSNE